MSIGTVFLYGVMFLLANSSPLTTVQPAHVDDDEDRDQALDEIAESLSREVLGGGPIEIYEQGRRLVLGGSLAEDDAQVLKSLGKKEIQFSKSDRTLKKVLDALAKQSGISVTRSKGVRRIQGSKKLDFPKNSDLLMGHEEIREWLSLELSQAVELRIQGGALFVSTAAELSAAREKIRKSIEKVVDRKTETIGTRHIIVHLSEPIESEWAKKTKKILATQTLMLTTEGAPLLVALDMIASLAGIRFKLSPAGRELADEKEWPVSLSANDMVLTEVLDELFKASEGDLVWHVGAEAVVVETSDEMEERGPGQFLLLELGDGVTYELD